MRSTSTLLRRRGHKARSSISGRPAHHAGFARAGARFYAWDDDEKALAAWVSELASAEHPEPSRHIDPLAASHGAEAVLGDLAAVGDTRATKSLASKTKGGLR